MLSSKPSAERPSETGDAFDAELGQPRGEVSSFAPLDGSRRGYGQTEVLRPRVWRDVAGEAPIHLPETARPHAARAIGLETRVLIVVPCLNEADVVADVIERLLDDDGLVDPALIVADGGSTDGTREIVAEIAARDPRVRLLHNPGRLQAVGLNLAVEAVGSGRTWMVRADAHADYPKNYASSLIAEARRTGAATVVVSMDTQGRSFFARAAAAAQNSLLGTGGAPHRRKGRTGWVDHGHHALFRLEAFEALGGYDETFSHNEDAEFDLRLRRRGGRIWLADRPRIVYHPRSTPAALWRQYFSYGKGRARTALKHFTPLQLRQALPLGVAPAVASLFAAPLFWPLAVPALTWAVAALGYGLLLGVRRSDPAALLSGAAAMIMHLAWSAGFWTQLFHNRPDPDASDGRARALGAAIAP